MRDHLGGGLDWFRFPPTSFLPSDTHSHTRTHTRTFFDSLAHLPSSRNFPRVAGGTSERSAWRGWGGISDLRTRTVRVRALVDSQYVRTRKKIHTLTLQPSAPHPAPHQSTRTYRFEIGFFLPAPVPGRGGGGAGNDDAEPGGVPGPALDDGENPLLNPIPAAEPGRFIGG